MKTKGDESINAIFLQHGLTHDSHVDTGLTKREYFAAMALTGIISKPTWSDEDTAKHAVNCADALINELNKEE